MLSEIIITSVKTFKTFEMDDDSEPSLSLSLPLIKMPINESVDQTRVKSE